MTIRDLQAAFTVWQSAQTPLVLASVYETEGSTYSKSGARMLIAADGTFQGMLSGGCLEGDLAERAMSVLQSGSPQRVTYDLGKNDEELWGLGVGCDGLMRIFLQPLLPGQDYQPFAAISEVLSSDDGGVAATVLESACDSIAPGATLVAQGEALKYFGIPEEYRGTLADAARLAGTEKLSSTRGLVVGGSSVKVLTARLLPPPRLLVLGAGLDALPVLRLAIELGWRVTVQDHRPAYIQRGNFSGAEQVLCVPAESLATRLPLERFDAAIVMSHHLATDRSYLQRLAETQIPYIGLLGPRDRKRRLLADLGEAGDRLKGRLHGPAGFDIGADGPASIALSILAEVHTALKKDTPRAARPVATTVANTIATTPG